MTWGIPATGPRETAQWAGGAWMPSDMPEEPEKKKKKTGYIVICSISGFVLVAGIVAAVVLLGLRGKKNDQDTLKPPVRRNHGSGQHGALGAGQRQ